MDSSGRLLPTRRALITGVFGAAFLATAGCSVASAGGTSAAGSTSPAVDPTRTPWATLADGNDRWAAGNPQRPHQDSVRRAQSVAGQSPMATVISCIDSRVPPELIFDTGIGDLLTVRVAAQIVDPLAQASVNYGPEAMDVGLIVVLGHQSCGAISATMEALKNGKQLPGDLEPISRALEPVYRSMAPDATVDDLGRAQVRYAVRELAASPVVANLIRKGKLAVVGAFFDLGTGKVTALTPLPAH